MEYEYTNELNTKIFDSSDFDRMMREFENNRASSEKQKNDLESLKSEKKEYEEPEYAVNEPVYNQIKPERTSEINAVSKSQQKQSKAYDANDNRASSYNLKNKEDNYETCFLKNVPKCLVDMAKECFPSQSNYKAVSAFLYMHRPPNSKVDLSSVPRDVIELAKSYKITDANVKASDDIKKINNNIRNILKTNDDILLALSYLIYDSAGFRQEEPNKPSEIPFYEPGIQTIWSVIEKYSDKMRTEKEKEAGRRWGMYGSKGNRKDELEI